MYLNAWFPADGTVWEGLRGIALLEEVCYCGGGALRFQKLMAFPAGSLCLMAVDQDVSCSSSPPPWTLTFETHLAKLKSVF